MAATHNRVARLSELLESLAAQTLPPEAFEVVIVDDCSDDGTPEILSAAQTRDDLSVRALRLSRNRGPAVARNAGWRSAAAPLVAFTDDDCVADPEWLRAGLDTAAAHSGAVVQGRTDPRPDELDRLGPFSRTLRVSEKGPFYQTCNVFYPRALLERLGGFDEETFSVPGGEDADLAWRAITGGAATVFAPDARVFHAVTRLGALGKLRVAARWTETVKIYARHRELRRVSLIHGVFWKRTHYLLLRLVLAVILPRSLRPLAPWLAYPYLAHLPTRGRVEGGGLVLAPFYLLHDLVEMLAVIRGAVRYRTLVI